MNNLYFTCNTVSAICSYAFTAEDTKTGIWHVTACSRSASILKTVTSHSRTLQSPLLYFGNYKEFCFWGFKSYGVWRCVTAWVVLSSSRKVQWNTHLLGLLTLEDEDTTMLQNVRKTAPAIQRHIPEDFSPQEHCCENLRSYSCRLLYSYSDTRLNRRF